MKIDQNPIKHLIVKVARDNKPETDRLHLFITIWTFLKNVEIRDAKPEGFQNSFDAKDEKLGILKFDINLVTAENTEVSSELNAVNKLIKVKNGYGFKFNFDNKVNNVLLTEVKLDIDPEGTKRTVITYEDTDVIDDTLIDSSLF